MALALEDFLTRFPEFEHASRDLVQAKIAEAELLVDANVYGDQADLAQGYLAAKFLALSPFGRNARMVQKDGSTTYGDLFDDLQSRVACGFRVI